jgi:hypothetical protein
MLAKALDRSGRDEEDKEWSANREVGEKKRAHTVNQADGV